MDRVEPARQTAKLAELSYDVAFQVELVHAAHASDEDDLARPRGDAERPRQAVQAPLLLEGAVGVEDQEAVVLPVAAMRQRRTWTHCASSIGCDMRRVSQCD